jgi:hypothetical protein
VVHAVTAVILVREIALALGICAGGVTLIYLSLCVIADLTAGTAILDNHLLNECGWGGSSQHQEAWCAKLRTGHRHASARRLIQVRLAIAGSAATPDNSRYRARWN